MRQKLINKGHLFLYKPYIPKVIEERRMEKLKRRRIKGGRALTERDIFIRKMKPR